MLWVSTFVGLGYFLGERWEAVEKNIHRYAVIFTIGAAILIAAWFLWKRVLWKRAPWKRARR